MLFKLVLSRLIPLLFTLAIGVVATRFTSPDLDTVSTQPSVVVPPHTVTAGTGSSGGNDTATRYHEVDRPFLPDAPPSDRSDGLKILAKPRAEYTERARASQVEGTVRLRVTLLANGDIGTIEVMSGLPDGLTEQAIDAAQRIRFTPATVDGRPVSKKLTIDYRFEIY